MSNRSCLSLPASLIVIAALLLWICPAFAAPLPERTDPTLQATMCVDPDWEPFERITAEGKHAGIAADLIQLIAQRVGVKLELVRTRDWEQSLAYSKAGRCDLVSFLNQTPERDAWLLFTEPHFVDPSVIITREEHDYVPHPARLSNETVALPAGTSIAERLRKDYPDLRVITVESEAQALKLVETRKADLTVRSLIMAAWTIKKEGWFNLKIAGTFPEYENRLRIGVRRDKPWLRDRLNRGVQTLEAREVQEIINRYITVTVASRIDYTPVFGITAGALTLFLAGLLWVRQLRRANLQLVRTRNRLDTELAARKQAETAWRKSEERYRRLVETAQEGILVIQDGKLDFFNPAFKLISGYPDQELENRLLADLFLTEDREIFLDNHAKRLRGEAVEPRYRIRMPNRDGSLRWVEISGTLIDWNSRPATLIFMTDATARVENEQRIHYMAHYDALTGLPNRALFSDRLQMALAAARRNLSRLAVAYLDIDGFKPVNDTYGHETGDMLLKAIAQRILGLVRQSDTVARIGGDEFVLLLPAVEQAGDAIRVAEKILAALNEAFTIDGHAVFISASIGIAVFPEHGETEIELARHADQAMYRIKREGRNGIAVFAATPGAQDAVSPA